MGMREIKLNKLSEVYQTHRFLAVDRKLAEVGTPPPPQPWLRHWAIPHCTTPFPTELLEFAILSLFAIHVAILFRKKHFRDGCRDAPLRHLLVIQ